MKNSKSYIAQHIEDMDRVARQLLKDIEHPLILFIGDLGSGKTTLIKALIHQLDSPDKGSSPSYALINEYVLPDGRAYHIDLYRLSTTEEAFNLGIEEIIYSGDYCFIEWPQIIQDHLDPPYHVVHIDLLENNDRKITLV